MENQWCSETMSWWSTLPQFWPPDFQNGTWHYHTIKQERLLQLPYWDLTISQERPTQWTYPVNTGIRHQYGKHWNPYYSGDSNHQNTNKMLSHELIKESDTMVISLMTKQFPGTNRIWQHNCVTGVGTHDSERMIQMTTQCMYNLMGTGRRDRLMKEETDAHAPWYA